MHNVSSFHAYVCTDTRWKHQHLSAHAVVSVVEGLWLAAEHDIQVEDQHSPLLHNGKIGLLIHNGKIGMPN